MKKLFSVGASLSFEPYWWETDEKIFLEKYDLPDGLEINRRLKMYTQIMGQVAMEENIFFIDEFFDTVMSTDDTFSMFIISS